ncbi:MAG: hypothetical protein JW986_05795 [Methanotrichaceae archaeon]|nr:hypothetical protein [Methanotrichaceae archaeon]
MRVKIEIEELVLRGFSPGDRYRIKESMEDELERMLAKREPFSLLGIEEGGNRSFQILPGDGPCEIGAKIARQVLR